MKRIASVLLGSLLVLTVANVTSAAEKKDTKAEPAAVAGPEGSPKMVKETAKATPKETAKEPAKEVTLKGTFGCAKCSFKEADKCQNVLHVKQGGKVTSYELADNDVSKDHHDDICHAPGGKPATIKGTVASEGDKKILTASKIMLK